MKSQFYRRKNKNRPTLPKACEDLKKSLQNKKNLKDYGYALDKSQFYVDTILCENYSFSVFQSQTVTDLIEKKIETNERKYLIDGKAFYTMRHHFSRV